MPLIGEELGISPARMSDTLSLYFMVFASCILVAGAFSDAYGRKPVLLAGMVLFTIGAAVCAVSDGYTALMTGRAVQALGASMIPGTLVAMVRDACSDRRIVTLMGWLAVLGGLFLVAAPMIGGVLTHLFGWSANFWFLVIFTTLTAGTTLFKLPETHPAKARLPLHFMRTVKAVGDMLASKAFMLVLVPVAAFFAIQGAFLAAAPYIVMDRYGLDPVMFGMSNVVIVIGLFIGRWAGAAALRRSNGRAIYRYGAFALLFQALLFTCIGFQWLDGLAPFLAVAGSFTAIFGAMAPIGMKSSVTAFRHQSGIAAALQGMVLMGSSALGSAAVGALLRHWAISDLAVFGGMAAIFCLVAAWAAAVSKPE
jgi:DHA1 family bicyclomycin/chloramphenicol resistance-like MFS transporter